MSEVVVLPTAELPRHLLPELRTLLDEAFEGDFDDDDWDHTLGGWHAMVLDGDAVLSHAAVVPRTLEVGGRPLRCGYVEGVATLPARQRQGLGRAAMAGAEEVIRAGFEMGALGTGVQEFYEHLGWERWLGPTSVRHPGGAVRTPDDDGGILVLRFGASSGLDLTAPISCEARSGDDW